MAKKTLGYTELEWTCANCDTKNPGLQKTCKSCGSPQPENVQFGIGAQQELLKDEQKVAQAQKGADLHCPYCGTRNPADAHSCSQCGGDLTGAAQRVSGKVISAAPNQPQGGVTPARTPLPSADRSGQSPQPVKTSNFRTWMLLPLAVLTIGVCVLLGFLFFYTDQAAGHVQSVSWERVVPIEELHDIRLEDWKDQIPQGAKDLSCDLKYRARQDSPAANATEICSTELVDKGNGAAEVVEDCSYDVYDDYCKYTAKKWEQIDQSVAQGNDLKPYWPKVNLAAGQREGERKAKYTVQFQTDKGIKEYTTDDENLFSQFQPGSTWTLEINPLGAIVSIEP